MKLKLYVRSVIGLMLLISSADLARGDHQTSTFSPVSVNSNLGYQINLRPVDLGIAELPTLHSYAVGTYDGKWVMLAGRTNGLHGFTSSGQANFPAQSQNRDVWVIDPANGQSWHQSLQDASSGLSGDDIAALTSTNNQFFQRGDRLYMTGGYGANATSGFDTHNALSAIDLPGIIDWVTTGTGTAANHIRIARDELFRVTGGAMYEIDGRVHLVFGQSFRGGYIPNRDGDYTRQVRSFSMHDDGVTLGFSDATQTEPLAEYRRRDLNVYPTLEAQSDGTLAEGLTVLSGVFTESFGAWTVPVEIDAAGNPSTADPDDPGTFKQSMNNYHSAKLGLYSDSTSEMHEILFGGITLVDYDAITQQFVRDDNLPWTNSITAVVRDESGAYQQHWLGEFPEILDSEGNRLRFGANAEFLLSDGIDTFQNGVIDMDALSGSTVLGHIYGGLFANAPHVRDVPGAVSGASNLFWEVTYVPVPEPSGLTMLLLAIVGWHLQSRRLRSR